MENHTTTLQPTTRRIDPVSTPPRVVNAFTVDVEDYFHVQSFAAHISRQQWDQMESRVVQNTRTILDLLNQHQVRGTFFVLGWVAIRFPQVVRDIQKAGHEIGTHGFWHRLIYEQTPDEFREDLVLSLDVLEQITGERVVAYRAPCFSITKKSLWAIDILIEEGIRLDSSIFPVYHDNYGIPDAQTLAHVIERPQGTLYEFPPTVVRLANLNLPMAGGGYFRLYPFAMTSYLLRRAIRTTNHPFMFYIHPWEVDPQQPRLQASLKSRFRHYQNLRSTLAKLDRLLAEFPCGTMSDSLQSVLPTSAPRPAAAAKVL